MSITKLPNRESNGFSRKWVNSSVSLLHESTVSPTVTRISGATDNHIFFSGNDPGWVIMTDVSLKPVDSFAYGIEYSEKLRAPGITIDSPNLYMYSGEISYLLKGKVQNPLIDTVKLKTSLITRFAQISPSRLIIRGIDSTESRQVFKLMDCISGETLKEVNLFPSQQLGGFETDGFLNFDKSTHRVIYMQMFQNKFFCLDTNLNLIYTAHTIDTTFTNPVTISLVKNETDTKIMSTNPRQTSNAEVCTGMGYIFVYSGLRADNEDLDQFNRNAPIDVYKISDGSYFASFSIPKVEGKSIAKMMIAGQSMIVLYSDGIVRIFRLPADILSQ